MTGSVTANNSSSDAGKSTGTANGNSQMGTPSLPKDQGAKQFNNEIAAAKGGSSGSGQVAIPAPGTAGGAPSNGGSTPAAQTRAAGTQAGPTQSGPQQAGAGRVRSATAVGNPAMPDASTVSSVVNQASANRGPVLTGMDATHALTASRTLGRGQVLAGQTPPTMPARFSGGTAGAAQGLPMVTANHPAVPSKVPGSIPSNNPLLSGMQHAGDSRSFGVTLGGKGTVPVDGVPIGAQGQSGFSVTAQQIGGAPPPGAGGKTTPPGYELTYAHTTSQGVNVGPEVKQGKALELALSATAEINVSQTHKDVYRASNVPDASRLTNDLGKQGAADTIRDVTKNLSPVPLIQSPTQWAGNAVANLIGPNGQEQSFMKQHQVGYSDTVGIGGNVSLAAKAGLSAGDIAKVAGATPAQGALNQLQASGQVKVDDQLQFTRAVNFGVDGKPGTLSYTATAQSSVDAKLGIGAKDNAKSTALGNLGVNVGSVSLSKTASYNLDKTGVQIARNTESLNAVPGTNISSPNLAVEQHLGNKMHTPSQITTKGQMITPTSNGFHTDAFSTTQDTKTGKVTAKTSSTDSTRDNVKGGGELGIETGGAKLKANFDTSMTSDNVVQAS